MTVDELICYGKKYLHKDQVYLLLSELLDINILNLYNHLDDIIAPENINKYKKQVQLLSMGKPIQYVLGKINFYGFNFQINENVLIPRFETEGLVEETNKLIKKYFKKDNLKVADLGTGSGVIGITLKKIHPNFEVDLIDISKDALDVATKNAKILNVDVNVLENDFLTSIDKTYDVIISNPPYIKENEQIEDIVKNNEPHLALYAGADGLDCYIKILKEIKKNLNKKYLIALEIGMTQKEQIIKLINKYLDSCQIITKKDLSLKDRYIFITNCE